MASGWFSDLKSLGAYHYYLVLESASALFFSMIFTASAVYQVTVAELTPLQLVLVGTALELTVFVFEIPTGVVADVFSRKLSIVIGFLLIGTGFVLEGSFPIFGIILLGQLVWGIGYTFTSGATQAWISDEIGETAANRAFLRSTQARNLMAMIGMGTGMILGIRSVNLPIQLGGIGLIILGGFLAMRMPETGFHPGADQEPKTWRNFGGTLKQGISVVRRRPALRRVLWIGLIYGLYSEGLDRLWTMHLLENFHINWGLKLPPVVWIGSIRLAETFLAVAAAEFIRRSVTTDRQASLMRALFAITGILVAAMYVFALAPILSVAIVAFLTISVMRELIYPIYTAWINQGLDSQVRATVISMSGQVDAVGQIAGGPVVGWIGNRFSVRAALLASSMILTPAIAFFLQPAQMDENEPDQAGE